MKAAFFALLVLPFAHCSIGLGCTANGTAIYFGNGMFNSVNDAQNSLVELKGLDVNVIESDQSKILYKLALNFNESKLENILEVLEERAQGDLSYFWDIMDSLLPMPDWLIEPIQKAFMESISSDTLDTMLTAYRNDLNEGRKILLVSHSQGNFYAEEAIKTLLSEFRDADPYQLGFGNVRVATPAQSLFRFPYFTFPDDKVIAWVSVLLGTPPPNLEVSGSGQGPYLDPNGHDFVKAYLANPISRAEIQSAMVDTAFHVGYPCRVQ